MFNAENGSKTFEFPSNCQEDTTVVQNMEIDNFQLHKKKTKIVMDDV